MRSASAVGKANRASSCVPVSTRRLGMACPRQGVSACYGWHPSRNRGLRAVRRWEFNWDSKRRCAPRPTAGSPRQISPARDRSVISPPLPGAAATRLSAPARRPPRAWSSTDLLATLKELEARRVSLVALNGMAFDLTIPHGRMMAMLLAGIAEFERKLTAERIRSGIAAAGTCEEVGRPAWAATEVGPPRAEGNGFDRTGPQPPPGRARNRTEQECGGWYRQATRT